MYYRHMLDLNNIESNLHELKDGLWVPSSADRTEVSFPDDSHDALLDIEENSFWFRHRNHCIIQAMKQLPPGGSIFDVGGGNGFVSAALVKSGIESILMEPGEQGAANAIRRGLRPVICSTVQDAGLRQSSIDAFGLFDVLEHIRDDKELLSTLHDLLKDNGRLYITVPAYGALWSVDDEYAGHFRRYRQGGLLSKLKEAGFKTEYCTYFMRLLPLPIFILRTLPGKLGLIKKFNTEDAANQHAQDKGILDRVLDASFKAELNNIKDLKGMGFGSSILAVVKK